MRHCGFANDHLSTLGLSRNTGNTDESVRLRESQTMSGDGGAQSLADSGEGGCQDGVLFVHSS